MAIKVHGLPFSTCTARVLLCLHEKGLDFELVPVDLAAAEHKKQPYLSFNPFRLVRALEDGDLCLFESRAITRYLARKHKDKGTDLLRQDNLDESAVADAWMEAEAHHFNGPMTEIFKQVIVNPMFGVDPDEEVIEAQTELVEKVFDVYEERLTKSKYLGGDHYTLAHWHHVPYLVYFTRTPKATNLVTCRPHVSAWWNDISSRPASIKVLEGLKL